MAGEAFETERIQITHKTVIEKIRMEHNHTLSSHAFSSLYLWQHAMGLSIRLSNDFFAVKCEMNGENSWFFPCGSDRDKFDFIKAHIGDETFSLCYMRKCDAEWLEERFPGKWNFAHIEDADEYICDIAEYTELSGSKFAEIRRKIRKIDKEHTVTASVISKDNMQDALSVVSKWNKVEHNVSEHNLTDDHIAEAALANMEQLDINGIVLYADGIPVSVFAGFPLSADTVDVLIGKSILDAPKGIVYYGLREYLKRCCKAYTYCNHEEDLGIEGIRQIKNSLCPISKTQIWEAVLK